MDSPLGPVELRVADLDAQVGFYRALFGLPPGDERPEGVELSPPEGGFRIRLRREEGLRARPRPSIGLFHLAFRLDSRAALAGALRYIEERGGQLEGASDHGVSEALYLSDAEGNGIELYRDRPREDWPTRGEDVAMTTDPLDLDALRELAQPQAPGSRAVLGHVHLHVPDLDEAERFFADGLGLTVRQRDYPGARFLAVDDYHHHVGVNTWARGRQAPDDAVGLEAYTWLGDPEAAIEHFEALGRSPRSIDGGIALEDPAGLTLRILDG